jgi:hypothetical protein
MTPRRTLGKPTGLNYQRLTRRGLHGFPLRWWRKGYHTHSPLACEKWKGKRFDLYETPCQFSSKFDYMLNHGYRIGRRGWGPCPQGPQLSVSNVCNS